MLELTRQLAPLATQAGHQEQLAQVDRRGPKAHSRWLLVAKQLPPRGVGQPAIGGLLVWLNFATHARYWIPYQVYPLF